MTPRRTGEIEYVLVRSHGRRTADIVVERDGSVQVRIPDFLPEEAADKLIERKRLWIYRSLAEWRDLNATRVLREFRNGEGFLYLGSSYRLSLVSNQKQPLLLADGRFRLRRSLAERGTAAARGAFRDFYTEKGRVRLERRSAHFAGKVGVQITGIKITDLGYRWASCTLSGTLRFHWRCMMAPAKIIDYIVVHELCHLRHRDHTYAFWNEVDKVMPDYAERKTWLQRNGAGLDV